MIGGEPAIDNRRGGRSSTGLSTKYARSRVTRPWSRYSIALASPVQYGLPIRQLGWGEWSGPSSASGAAGCHALQRPAVERVRNDTEPPPPQRSPTMSNGGGAADLSVR